MDSAWLVVVDRHRPELCAYLRLRLAGRARVILDRRTGASRDSREDHRHPATLADAILWQEYGVRVVVPSSDAMGDKRARAEVRRALQQLNPRLAAGA
jgi:hypothetical protein